MGSQIRRALHDFLWNRAHFCQMNWSPGSWCSVGFPLNHPQIFRLQCRGTSKQDTSKTLELTEESSPCKQNVKNKWRNCQHALLQIRVDPRQRVCSRNLRLKQRTPLVGSMLIRSGASMMKVLPEKIDTHQRPFWLGKYGKAPDVCTFLRVKSPARSSWAGPQGTLVGDMP